MDFVQDAIESLERGDAVHILLACYPGDPAAMWSSFVQTREQLQWMRERMDEVFEQIEEDLDERGA